MPRPILALLMLLCCVALPAQADKSLPRLAGPADALLSSQQAYEMGRAWLRGLRKRVSILQDPLVQSYSEHLVWRLLAYSGLQDVRLDLVVVDTTDINAFAVPGGVIGINAGTLLHADSADEVAAVLAHELAHVSQHHFARRYTDNRLLSRSFLVAMLASIALAASGHAEAGLAGLATTQAAAIQTQLAYSRSQEAEADRIGMQILTQAGFDPGAMPRFFEQLLQQELYGSEPPPFLVSHPVTESRIADTRARARSLPSPPHHASLDFLLAQARLKAFYIHDANAAEDYFSRLYHGKPGLQQLAAGYGLALAAKRNHHNGKALSTLDQLLQQSPNNWWFKLAKAEVYMASQNYQQANRLLHDLAKLLPGNYAVNIFYARSLLHAGDAAKAAKLLQQQRRERSGDPLVWQLSAKVFGKLNQPARAHMAQGEYLFLNGHGDKGLKQLHYALKSSQQQFALHSRIKARLKAMKQAVERDF